MLKLMVLMNENQSDCHRSVQPRFRVLRNYGSRPSLSKPTMPGKVRGGVVLTIHQPCDGGGEGIGTVNLDT
jgi:hypothetical protein